MPQDFERLSKLGHERDDRVFDTYMRVARLPGMAGIGDLMKRMLVESVVYHERQIISMVESNESGGERDLEEERKRYRNRRQQVEDICGADFEDWYQDQRQGLLSIGSDGQLLRDSQ